MSCDIEQHITMREGIPHFTSSQEFSGDISFILFFFFFSLTGCNSVQLFFFFVFIYSNCIYQIFILCQCYAKKVMFSVALGCLFVYLFVKNITQKVTNGLQCHNHKLIALLNSNCNTLVAITILIELC